MLRENIAPLWAWLEWGYRTREAAEDALEHAFAAALVSEGERPRVRSYRSAVTGSTLWGIQVEGWI